MSLKARITEDMKAAMRAKDSERLGTPLQARSSCSTQLD